VYALLYHIDFCGFLQLNMVFNGVRPIMRHPDSLTVQ